MYAVAQLTYQTFILVLLQLCGALYEHTEIRLDRSYSMLGRIREGGQKPHKKRIFIGVMCIIKGCTWSFTIRWLAAA